MIGRKEYVKPAVRSRSEQASALAAMGGKRERVYAAQTRTGTMADRILQAKSQGKPLALAFARGKQSGVVSVVAGELSFSVPFDNLDLQELLADALVAYFQRAHATRERVSAKARTGGGTHGSYDLVRSVDVVVRLKGGK